ncbi:MAG: type II secretion system F family protein [Sulfurovaceae bacterium]|nr:type II secretion system F family protein [Sulfurovaceae bacterium]
MNYFHVSILHKGKKQIELAEADTRNKAKAKIKLKFPHAIIINIEPTSPPMSVVFKDFTTWFQKIFKKKINMNDKISTIRQISVMTDAGIPIHDTLNDVALNTHNKQLGYIYSDISNDIDAGRSLSDAMGKYREEFGHVALAMARLGERTGSISSSFGKLADIFENVRDNAAKFKKAIRYPLITLVAMAIAFTVLIMVVVPKFKAIFEQFKTELPLPTRILLGIEYVLSNYGVFVLIALLGGIYAIIYFYKNDDKFKMSMDKLLISKKFYLINKVIFLSTMHKYTLVFSELIRSGIPVSDALQTALGMVDNAAIKQKLEGVNINIKRGLSLSEAFEQTGLFENMLLQMIRAGETSGQLDLMLGKITEYYDMQFQDIIDNLSTYIEPILMFFIALLVLLMALGIFMPMWDLGKAVKGG